MVKIHQNWYISITKICFSYLLELGDIKNRHEIHSNSNLETNRSVLWCTSYLEHKNLKHYVSDKIARPNGGVRHCTNHLTMPHQKIYLGWPNHD